MRDVRRLAPHLQGLTESQARLFLLGLLGLRPLRARWRALNDHLLAEAVSALRKTVETRERGVLYEHAAEDVRARGLVPEVRGLFEAKDAAGVAHAPQDKELLPVLRSLESALAECLTEAASPTAFLDTALRVAGQGAPPPPPPVSPLIVQP